jgi:tetratricopeptide (TPR) repeat protein
VPDDDLFKPTIIDRPMPVQRPWRVDSLVYPAFFGGPLAVMYLGALNARRLGVGGRQVALILLSGVVALVAQLLVFALFLQDVNASAARVSFSLAGVAVWGVAQVAQRRPFRIFLLRGGEPASLWGAGIGAAIASALIQLLLMNAVTGMSEQAGEQARDTALARAWVLLEADRAEQALAELSRLSPEQAVTAAAFHLRGQALIRLERWREVDANARNGLAEVGPDPVLFGQLGFALVEAGEFANAERNFLHALSLDPYDVDLLCAYSRLCLSASQADKARQLWERAATLNPFHRAVMATRVVLAIGTADDREAQRASDAFVAEYPADPMALAFQGQVAEMRGRSGYGSIRQAVANDPTDRDYADLAWEAKVHAHPLMAPLRPMFRLGTVKSWLLAMAVIFGLRMAGLRVLSLLATLVWVVLCLYSWVVPPLVRKWVFRHRR